MERDESHGKCGPMVRAADDLWHDQHVLPWLLACADEMKLHLEDMKNLVDFRYGPRSRICSTSESTTHIDKKKSKLSKNRDQREKNERMFLGKASLLDTGSQIWVRIMFGSYIYTAQICYIRHPSVPPIRLRCQNFESPRLTQLFPHTCYAYNIFFLLANQKEHASLERKRKEAGLNGRKI